MIDSKLLREHPDIVKKAVADKKAKVDVNEALRLDGKYRGLAAKLETLNRGRNIAAKAKDIAKGKALKEEAAVIEKELAELEPALNALLEKLPNIPTEDTPVGPDESGNVVIKTVGEPTVFAFAPKDHVALGAALGIIDNERASAVSGARFTYLKGDLVLLQYALLQYALSILTSEDALTSIIAEANLDVLPTPFMPVAPPLMIKPEVFQKMARLEPKEERYHIPSDDLYLIGSAEHTLGPLHMGETIPEAEFPKRYVAFTAAFRREAGSYGKDTRGILRLHQFDKIEMESFSLPERSRQEQDLFVAIQEHFLRAFGIPYQVVQVCTGDMGVPDSRQIDIESWMPGQQRYRETHTADLMTDYQARRLGIRVRRAKGGSEFVHMNDATAIAMGRSLIALIENHQREDGSIAVPEPLVPFMMGKTAISRLPAAG